MLLLLVFKFYGQEWPTSSGEAPKCALPLHTGPITPYYDATQLTKTKKDRWVLVFAYENKEEEKVRMSLSDTGLGSHLDLGLQQ